MQEPLPRNAYAAAEPAAPLESPPSPELVPQQGPALPPPTPWLKIFLGLLSSVCLGVLMWSLANTSRNELAARGAAAQFRTAVAASGTLESTLRVGGTIETRDYAAIRAPRMRGPRDSGQQQLTLAKLAEPGSIVAPGAMVAEFELKWLEDHIDDRMSVQTQSEARVEKRRAEIMVLRETDRQARVTAKAEYEKSVLDVRTAAVKSEIEAEILKNMAEEANVTWKQLEEEGRMMEGVHRSDLRTFELQVVEDRLHTERHQRDYERLSIETPVGGLVVLETMYKGNGQFDQTSAGDRVYPGALFMRVVDVSQMVLNASVNQVDAQAVRIGQKAKIFLDAYPGMELTGRIFSVGAIATSGGGSKFSRSGPSSYMKNIPVLIALEEQDRRVLPDLSASADIMLSAAPADVIVPRSALRNVGGQTVVYVRDGEGFEERKVVVDGRNDTHAAIRSGLKAGEDVLLSELPEIG